MLAQHPRRNRIVSACAIAIAAWLGINSRRYAPVLPDFVAAYAGDTLWAMAAFAMIGLAFPAWPTWQTAAGAFVVSALVEFSQWYHAPWIDAIRGTPLGALALGSEFVATDLACYAVGVFLGMLIEFWMLE